jgi:hypothetical protein
MLKKWFFECINFKKTKSRSFGFNGFMAIKHNPVPTKKSKIKNYNWQEKVRITNAQKVRLTN